MESQGWRLIQRRSQSMLLHGKIWHIFSHLALLLAFVETFRMPQQSQADGEAILGNLNHPGAGWATQWSNHFETRKYWESFMIFGKKEKLWSFLWREGPGEKCPVPSGMGRIVCGFQASFLWALTQNQEKMVTTASLHGSLYTISSWGRGPGLPAFLISNWDTCHLLEGSSGDNLIPCNLKRIYRWWQIHRAQQYRLPTTWRSLLAFAIVSYLTSPPG